jgi:hypothetical protein
MFRVVSCFYTSRTICYTSFPLNLHKYVFISPPNSFVPSVLKTPCHIMSEASPPRRAVSAVFQSSSAATGRLIHLIPDDLAKAVPDHPLFSYPKTAKPRDGFVDVSSKRFANAINRTSWWLKSLLGPPQNFDTVGYMGPSEFNVSMYLRRMILMSQRRYTILSVHVCGD